MKRNNILAATIMAVLSLFVLAQPLSAQTVPKGFDVTLLATGLSAPKGIVSAHFRAGGGPFGNYVYVAESNLDRIVKVDKDGSGYMAFATVGDFPVGVAIYGGPFGQYLYAGNASSGDGIDRVDSAGNAMDFALNGYNVAGLDFGRGDYGPYLYAGVWQAGEIWKVDGAGNAMLFATLPMGSQSRYLKFSHGGAFGHYLYVTDFLSGDIYRVDPAGNVSLFASTGDFGLEGLDFSSGGAFGKYLYAGSLSSGNLYQIDPQGNVSIWAHSFDGVADIHFEPGGKGGFTMYIVDGDSSVYAIHK